MAALANRRAWIIVVVVLFVVSLYGAVMSALPLYDDDLCLSETPVRLPDGSTTLQITSRLPPKVTCEWRTPEGDLITETYAEAAGPWALAAVASGVALVLLTRRRPESTEDAPPEPDLPAD